MEQTPARTHIATGCPAFDADLEAVRALALASVTTSDALAANLTAIYRRFHDADLGRYDPAALASSPDSALETMFALRMGLRDRIPEWQRNGLMTRDVQRALRDVFRMSRYATDMVGEVVSGFDVVDPGESALRAFSGDRATVLIAPRYRDPGVTFETGDVLLVRGMLANSAAIARIGDVDSQFSHVGMVFVDAAGKPWIVEALIEKGATIAPLETALDHGLGRALLLRHRDRDLARRAGELIQDHVGRMLAGKLPHIPYDFSMQLGDYRQLFCSKLVRLAYAMASDGAVQLPTFNTRLDMQNRDFFERIGVTATETFAPGDIELEPDFDVVAEWRDFRETPRLRLQDLTMDKLFQWMDEHGYTFNETLYYRLIGLAGHATSYLPQWLKGWLPETYRNVPRNMTARTISAIAMLHDTTAPIFEHLRKRDRATIAETGRPLHPRLVRDELEAYRARHGARIGSLRIRRG